MFLKRVSLCGFKSFSELTHVNLDSNCCVIVGRNGSGKSNLFSAIAFVLEGAKVDRTQLISPGKAEAFVEIEFDNTERRLAIGEDRVIIRRTVSTKHDLFSLNGKSVVRQEIKDIFATCGIAGNNSWFIIQQGEINKLAMYSEKNLLELLTVVAGSKEYSEKREASLKNLHEVEKAISELDNECLQKAEQLIEELEGEKEELVKFRKYEKERRGIEHAICQKDLNRITANLRDIIAEKTEALQVESKIRGKAIKMQDERKRLHQEKEEIAERKGWLEDEFKQVIRERDNLVKKRSQFKMKIEDLKKQIKTSEKTSADATAEISELKTKINIYEQKLERRKKDFDEIFNRESQLAVQLAEKQQKYDDLIARKSRRGQFETTDERNEWIDAEAQNLEEFISGLSKDVDELNKKQQVDGKEKKSLEKKVREQNVDRSEQVSLIDSLKNELRDQKLKNEEKESALIKKQMLMNTLQKEMANLELALDKTKVDLEKRLGKNIVNGFMSMETVLQKLEEEGRQDILNGFLGLLIDHLEFPPELNIAVDVCGGKRLFYFVTKTALTGHKILRKFNAMHLRGEVNFISLDKLNVYMKPFPPGSTPLKEKIQIESPEIEKPVDYLFGKILLVSNSEECNGLRGSGFSCVSLDGDQTTNKGVLSGGFLDPRRSKVSLYRAFLETKTKIMTLRNNIQNETSEIDALQADVSESMGSIQKLETKLSRAMASIEDMDTTKKVVAADVHFLQERIDRNAELKRKKQTELAAMKTQLADLREELNQSQLSFDQSSQESVEELRELQNLKEKQGQAFAEKSLSLRKMNGLKNGLETLQKQLDDLNVMVDEKALEEARQSKDAKVKELDIVNKDLESMQEKYKEVERDLQKCQKLEIEANAKSDHLGTEVQEITESLEVVKLRVNKILGKEETIRKSLEECRTTIGGLGCISEKEMLYWEGKTMKQCSKRLGQINKALKKFENVNKQALDQYNTIVKANSQREKTRESLVKDYEAVKDLVAFAEQKKAEQLEFTIQRVRKYFAEIFSKLVPSGRASLELIWRHNSDDDSSSQTDSDPGSMGDLSRAKGLQVRVRFSGSHDTRISLMSQLSGGQKSIVALALIFAIQQCDPAPFYLFDEVDAAIDNAHRANVAEWINARKDTSQFVMTTFRPELLECATKFIGIKFRNNVSHAEETSKEMAKDFVVDDAVQA